MPAHKNKLDLAVKLEVCPTCLHKIRLGIHPDEGMFYIALGCQCGPFERLSEYYSDRTDARMDLISFSWRELDGTVSA